MPQSPISERVFSLFDRKKGKTQAALARFCGITTGAVAQWRTGGIDFKHLPKIAKFFGVTEEWLRDGQQDINVYVPGEEEPPPGVVAIPEYELTFGASNQSNSQEPEWVVDKTSTPRWYPIEFFQQLGVNPKRCKRARVTGDSMEPMLFAGDSVLWISELDPRVGCVHIRDGEIYVLSIDGTRKIKRLSKVKGGIEVISDNSRYKPETYSGDECDTMRIYGRVVEIIRKV